MLTLVALRNLWRNRRRTAISVLVIAIGVTALLLTLGFVRHSFDGLSEAIITGGLGHIEVAPASTAAAGISQADRSSVPPELDDWRTLRDLIERQPHVRAVGAVTQFAGVATYANRSAGVVGVALEPERQARMGMVTRLRAGDGLPAAQLSSGEDRVLLGTGLAKALGVVPGDVIVVMAATSTGTLNALDLTVCGTFTSGLQDLDGRMIQVHIVTAERLLATDRISSLVVSLDRLSDTTRVAEALRRDLAGRSPALAVLDWESRAPFYRQVRGLYSSVFVFLGAIVAALVTLSISNTLLMSVLERVREFGMLLAIGTSRAQLAVLIVCEALWLAAIGSVAGSVLTMLLAWAINAARIEMPPPPAAADPITLALAIAPTDYLWLSLFMLGLLAAAALVPVSRVLRLRVVDALAHV